MSKTMSLVVCCMVHFTLEWFISWRCMQESILMWVCSFSYKERKWEVWNIDANTLKHHQGPIKFRANLPTSLMNISKQDRLRSVFRMHIIMKRGMSTKLFFVIRYISVWQAPKSWSEYTTTQQARAGRNIQPMTESEKLIM